MKYIKILLFCAFSITVGQSQDADCARTVKPHHKLNNLEWLQAKLDLTADQVSTLESQWEDTKGRSEKKALVLGVLTTQQAEKFEQFKKNRGHHRHNGTGADGRRHHHYGKFGKARKQHWYHHRKNWDEESASKLIEMRTELEQHISDDDQVALQELRVLKISERKSRNAILSEKLTEQEKAVLKEKWKCRSVI